MTSGAETLCPLFIRKNMYFGSLDIRSKCMFLNQCTKNSTSTYGINLGSNISVQPNYIGFISKGGGTSSIISETTTFH
jgi:hypothetical protein